MHILDMSFDFKLLYIYAYGTCGRDFFTASFSVTSFYLPMFAGFGTSSTFNQMMIADHLQELE